MFGQLGRRVSDAFGYFAFALVGAIVGWHLGVELGGLSVALAFRDLLLFSVKLHGDELLKWKVAWRISSGSAMSVYCIVQGTTMHDRHLELKGMMRKHQLTFYALRHLNPVSFLPFKVVTWAFFYTISGGFIVPLIAIGGGVVSAGAIDSLNVWFRVLVGIVVGYVAFWLAGTIVDKLFSRNDLKLEIEEAALMIQAYGIAREEARGKNAAAGLWEQGDANDELPPWR